MSICTAAKMRAKASVWVIDFFWALLGSGLKQHLNQMKGDKNFADNSLTRLELICSLSLHR